MSVIEENTFHTCRACLMLSNHTYSIFQTVFQEENIGVLKMLNYFLFEIQEDDDLPKTICYCCLTKLQISYNFFETFKKSQDILQQQYSNKCLDNSLEISNQNLQEDGENCHKEQGSNDLLPKESEEETEESIIIRCEETEESHDSDDEDYLIEKSVRLTAESNYMRYDSDQAECRGSDSDENFKNIEETFKNIDESFKNNDNNKTEPIDPSHGNFLVCPICAETFRTYYLFSIHMRKYNRNIDCRQCSVSFSSADLYLRHYQLSHRYNCKNCKKSFLQRNNFLKHMQIHKNPDFKFSCPAENCSKTFRFKQSLQNHCATIHSDQRNFLCTQCGAAFKNYDNLRYHIKKHEGPSHMCSYCGKAFMMSAHLKDHMWVHVGVKPFTCQKCNKSFTKKRNLNKHMAHKCTGQPQKLVLDSENV